MSNHNINLSEHFSLDELADVDHHEIFPVQWFMLQNICVSILEPLRSFACSIYNREISFRITSGLRSSSDRERLIKEGYNPSENSDHDYGQVVKLVSDKKKALFGPYYYYSVGAVDFMPSCGAELLFNACKPYFNKSENSIDLPTGGRVRVGQFILEKGNQFWIHVSNPPKLFFGAPILGAIKRNCFLMSMDNGKTYQLI